jgi:hypothetical protein
LQGRANYTLQDHTYRGGELIQYAPLFPALGNHEVMGRFSSSLGLDEQFDQAIPRSVAQREYDQKTAGINPNHDPNQREQWLVNHSFNTHSYEELFTLPQSSTGGKRYYAVTIGDVRLVVLFITNIWRSPNLDDRSSGRYGEATSVLHDPQQWRFGQHIFEPITPGSPQYIWLKSELNSPEFQQAKFKIAMFHHPPHSLGANVVPAYTNPVPIVSRNPDGSLQSIRYDYPQNQNYLIRDVVPLLEAAGVQLVFFGHSHLWNRFKSPKGMHFLETSNVGNSYGAYVGDRCRPVPPDPDNYAATGNPYGLEPIVPTLAPLKDSEGDPLPYIASNKITVFSIVETASGVVNSYRFDTCDPNSEVILFDAFFL